MLQDGGFALFLDIFDRFVEHQPESLIVKDVLAQHKGNTLISDELLINDECLCQYVGIALLSIRKL
jgi:hypothetical protein